MADNQEGGPDHEDTQAGTGSRGGLQEGAGTGDENLVRGGSCEGGERNPHGDPGQGEGEDGADDLHYRLEILEALKVEPDPQVRLALVHLLEAEGQRAGEVAGLELKTGEALQLADIGLSKQVQATRREQLAAQSTELNHASWRATAMWAVPAAFAVLMAFWLTRFLYLKDYESAKVLKELLILLMTGALGWAAGRRGGE